MERDLETNRRAALVLGARLLFATAKGVGRGPLTKSLLPWLPPEYDQNLAIAILEQQGFIQHFGKSLGLTALGRREVLSELGLSDLVGVTKFEALAKRVFPALALSIEIPELSGDVKRFSAVAGLMAAIVRAENPKLSGLPSVPAKEADVLMPLAIEHLRTRLQVKWGNAALPKLSGHLYQSVLASLVGQERPIPQKVALESLARRALGVPKELSIKDWPRELTRRWILGRPTFGTEVAPSSSTSPSLDDPKAFVEAIRAATADSATGWFGTDRFFIAAAYDALINKRGAFPGGRAAFDERLLSAARAGLIKLSRADYVEAMDKNLIVRSKIDDRGVERHFLEDWQGSDL